MLRESVASSAISSVGYDPESETLEVEFSSGAVYEYYGVPRKVYRSLMSAPSKGQFWRGGSGTGMSSRRRISFSSPGRAELF